ncbi:MAG: ATP-binding protein [Verrucomicrobiota bacterium]
MIGHFIEGSLVLSILAMVGLTGVGESPYYAGLCLIMVGASLLLRWSIWHGLVNVVLCCGGYTLLILILPESSSNRGLATSLFFLWVTGCFTAAGTYFLYGLRLNEYRLREELNSERRALEESHRQLKELDESKTNFFANVSHELRTPLTLILGPVEQLATFGPIQQDEKLKKTVNAMEENGMRLLRLINELLDLIRLDGRQNEVKTELLSVSEFASSVHTSLFPVADQKGLELTLDVSKAPDGLHRLDRNKLEKILVNLATNAVKFTSPGGRVSISVDQPNEKNFRLMVEDTGKGMTPSEVQNVFRRFWQADTSAKRRHRGAGIGLSLVKGLVELLEGEIFVKSKLGEGTKFTVTLPLGEEGKPKSIPVQSEYEVESDPIEKLYRKASLEGATSSLSVDDAVRPETAIFEETSSGKPLVLIAEDEPDLRDLIVGQLSDYRLLVAHNGEQAIQLARQYLPDLMLLDWMMPERDGLEVCSMARDTPSLERVPIVMLTARIDERSKLDALAAGANDFLTKPFVPTELKLRVGQLIESNRYQKEVVMKSKELGVALEDLKESESMLVQAEKLSSLGEMSAGIIHEINNPLNYSKTNLYSLRMFMKLLPPEEQQDFREITADVEEGLERVSQIVKDLRSFAVKDKAIFTEVNLAEVVETTGRLLGNRLTNIRFETNVPDHIYVDGNSNQICQVLVNFVQNALDAIEMQGRGEDGFIEIECVEKEDHVTMSIRDNGCGISDEDRTRIFDPFFTSKEIGKGMGLGLSICYRILEQHGVRTEIESEIGVGTHFTLNFFGPPEQPEVVAVADEDLVTSKDEELNYERAE